VSPGVAANRIDTLRVYETPEGVDLGLRTAGPVVRAAALVLDVLIKGLLYLALVPLLALSGVGIGLVLLGVFLLEWFYPVFFELRSGATPGKKAMGIAVVQDDGTPITPAASLVRNLLRVVDFLPVAYGAGLICTLIDRDFRRLGDLAAGTLVVHVRAPPAVGSVANARPVPLPEPLPLPLQQAILAYAERAPRLSPERRAELAEAFSGPDGHRGEAAHEALLGHASWLARGR
jgi:uncharacterized RDD family membrane protein YckC